MSGREQLLRACITAIIASSSSNESDSHDASYSDTYSGILSLSYSTSDASHESTDLPNGEMEPYLYEPVESHSVYVSSSVTSEDDDSQDSQRLLSTVKHKGTIYCSSYVAISRHYALM